jgi:tetratricopeptide (TPR) repeat protein
MKRASIAEMLSSQRYDEIMRAEMRGVAQLERANALRYLGRFNEALEALDVSEQAYRSTPISDRPLALTKFLRSVIYMKSERLDEAAQLASESLVVFRMYGDRARIVHAQIVIGGCLFQRGEFTLARDLYRRLVREARAIGESATEALCLMDLAHAETELREFASALVHYSDAVDIYERLGMRTEVLRTRWGAADLVALMGNIPVGIEQLRKTAAAMLVLGLVNDHALALLDAVGKLFDIGRLAELPDICADLVRVFDDARMPENSRTALAYLEAAARAGAVTTPLIDCVSQYIEREEYAAPFAPPA